MRGVINKHFGIVRNIYIYILLAVALLLLILFPIHIKQDGASAVTGTATASTTSLTIASGNNTASVAITPTNTNGSFATSNASNKAEFNVSTNNYTGYTLAITASDNTGNLVNTATNDTIASITTNLTESSFNTSANNNKWGFKPSKYVANNTVITNTGDNSVYLPSPTTTPTLLDKTNVANSAANNYTIALGIRADHNTTAGTYTKTFTLVATANPTTYTINYNKNTTDTVSNLPSTSTTGSTTSTSITLPNTVPTRAHYSFLGWCSTTTTTSNGIDSCSGTVYNPNGAGTNLTYGLDQTTANTTTLYAMWKIDTFTCTKQYRLEKEDGSWEAYQQEPATSNDIVNYGGSCSYTKTITNYRGASNAANGAQGSTSASNITADTTLSLDFYRNTYTLTVSAGTNTSNPSGSGTYRWGYAVPVSVTKNTDITCTSYGTPTWTATAGTAPAAGASTSFTMPTSNATITATSAASNVAQTITLSRSGGASGINIGGTNYTSSSVSLTCGTYNVSGNYSSGYEFSSWSRSGSVTVANTGSATTTMTVSGAGTLSLAGKSSKLFFQNATSAQCGQTMYDNRGTDAYKNIAYSTASINGLCWMTRNLDLPGGTTLTADNSNVSAGCNLGGTNNCTLPASSTSGFSSAATAYVYNSGSTTCGNGSPCYSYYSYVAATAGTNPSSGEATSDICPKGWRLPTYAEYIALKNTYTTGATLTASPFYGVYAGDYSNSSFNDGGSNGDYWSSTASKSSYAYYLYFYSSRAVTSSGSKYRGFSVRCVAK